MLKKQINFALVGSVALSSVVCAGSRPAKDIPVVDLKTIVSSKCEMINPEVLKYLDDSDYLSKKEKHLQLAIKYHAETDQMLKELKDDASRTSMQSKILFGSGITLLGGSGIAMSRVAVQSSGAITQGVRLAGSSLTKGFGDPTVLGLLHDYGIAAGVLATGSGAAYMGFAEPFVAIYQHKLSEAKSQKEAQDIFASLDKDFATAEKQLDQLRYGKDLEYSTFKNAITLGSSAKKATQKLYSISVAKTLLYQAQLDLVESLKGKLNRCTSGGSSHMALGVNDSDRSIQKDIEVSVPAKRASSRASKQ